MSTAVLRGAVGCGLAVLLLSGCGDELTVSSSTAGVRDSAGIRIVENGVPAPPWRVRDDPIFVVGWGADDPQFAWPRSGRILPGGGALIGDSQTGALYVLGPDGGVQAAWERKGEGPGEFESLDTILLRGDTIVISDSRLRRFTLLSMDGELIRTRPMPGAFLHQVSAVTDKGRVILTPADAWGMIDETRREWVFQTQPILSADLDGVSIDTLAHLPHLRRWYGDRGASPGPVRVRGAASGFGGGFVWGRSDRSELRWYDESGSVVQIARWTEEPTWLTADLREGALDSFAEALRARGTPEPAIEDQIGNMRGGFDRHEGPIPVWAGFYANHDGDVLLSDYNVLARFSERWRLVTRDGAVASWSDIDLIHLLDATESRLLGVRRNELDVSAVVMLEFEHP